MNPIVLVCMFVAGALANADYAAPASPPAAPAYGYGAGASEGLRTTPIPITRYSHEMQEMLSHRIAFETGHGITHEDHLAIKVNPNAVGTAEDAHFGSADITKTGNVAYTSPDGQKISLNYVADENGYRPTGDHLPVAPTQPAEIVEAIRQFQIAYDAAAKAAAEAPEFPEARPQQGSYGYAAPPAPLVRAPAPAPQAPIPVTLAPY